ncbi:MAG: aminotransferase class V-fold PLP-dependent enzyme [Chlamydiota bacterium]
MNEPVYLDHHSATPPLKEVLETFVRTSKEYWGVISSFHFIGQQPMYPLQKAVNSLFDKLGAKAKDELFLLRGEEAVWRVFFHTYLQVSRETGKTLFLTAQEQEMSWIKLCAQMEELGCSHKALPLNAKGQVTRQALEAAITPRTALFSISWADGLTGVIHPVEDLVAVCREKNVLFHIDASYVFGKRFFRFQDIGADFLTIDGASIQSLQDTGLLFIKEGTPVRLERSAPSIAIASTLALAVEERQSKFEHYCMETARLRDRLEEGVLEGFSEAVVLFKEADRLPNVTVIAFQGVYSEALLFLLNSKGIYASFGGGKFQQLEAVLVAAGVEVNLAKCALSFSLSWDTSEEEIEHSIELIIACAKQIKRCSKEIDPCKNI